MASSSTHALQFPTEATRHLLKGYAPRRADYSIHTKARGALCPAGKPRAVFESHPRSMEKKAPPEPYYDKRVETQLRSTVPTTGPRVRESSNPQTVLRYAR